MSSVQDSIKYDGRILLHYKLKLSLSKVKLWRVHFGPKMHVFKPCSKMHLKV